MTNRERVAKFRAQAIADGNCSRCLNKPHAPGKTKCVKCARRTREWTYEQREQNKGVNRA